MIGSYLERWKSQLKTHKKNTQLDYRKWRNKRPGRLFKIFICEGGAYSAGALIQAGALISIFLISIIAIFSLEKI